jgi:hypothetical protein
LKIEFTVPGPLFPYRRIRDKGRYQPYAQYKNRVLSIAMEHGWKGRVASVKDWPVRLSVIARWKNNPRSDHSNIFKGIEDALFTQDRYVIIGSYCDELWDTKKPEEAIVILEIKGGS